jgi:NadR type nicotinamide-nucleotide adenylyltransferase
VITGAESTGKTVLAEALALHFQGYLVPEYARSYVEKLDRPYDYSDVRNIARQQIQARNRLTRRYSEWLFFDTDLIVTRVWFLEVFGRCPGWLDKNIQKQRMDLYLLCNNDVPWIPDGIRENGGERRDYLYQRYREELESFRLPYVVVDGQGDHRFKNALEHIHEFLERWNLNR